MKPWNKLTDKGKIRRLQREKKALERQIDSLQSQVNQAARATNDMGAHCRALEVSQAAAALSSQGINVFGNRSKAKSLAVGLHIPELSQETKQLTNPS